MSDFDLKELEEELSALSATPEDTSFKVETLVKCVIVGLIGMMCVVGNVLVIRTLIFFKYPKIPIYVIIGGLAVADILKITLEIPQNVIQWTHKGEGVTSEFCQAIFYLVSTCTYVASCHLVGLSIIRCVMLNDRGRSRSYVFKSFIGSIIIWVATMVANIPNAKAIYKDDLQTTNMGCMHNNDITDEDERNLWLRVSFSYILPLMVIAVVYIVTWYFTQRFFEDSYSHRERRLSKMVTLLIVTFALCKLPNEIMAFIVFYKGRDVYGNLEINLNDTNIWDNFEGEKSFRTWYTVKEYSDCFVSLDLAIRPIIYAKLSYYFSKSFDEVINCTSCREASSSGGSMKKRKPNGPSQTPLTQEPEIAIEINDGTADSQPGSS